MRAWGLRVRRVLTIPLLFVVLAAALCVGGLVPYFLSAWTASIPLLAFSAICAFAVVAWLGGWLGGLVWRATQRTKFANIFTPAFSALFVTALYFAVLRPYHSQRTETIRFANTQYWQLPTGSRIAYTEYEPPAGMAANPNPVVFLHGGPGMRVAPWDHELLSPLAVHGFRVVLFDQAGSGLSDFLPRVRDYKMNRAVADLEAIRQSLGADKLILVGHSWGSTLAASYMAKYPDHVAKVVFYSPAPIWNLSQDLEKADYSRTDGGTPGIPSPRLIAAIVLLDRNPDAAQNLLPQEEAAQLLVPFMASTGGTFVCKGDAGKLPPLAGPHPPPNMNPRFNPYALMSLIHSGDQQAGDPHAALRSNKTPAMILFGECDYLPWSSKLDYRKTFSNANIYYVPKAGHFIQFEQPDLLQRMIFAFLLDQPDVVSPYSGDADPRTVHP
jgi:pimeloyl-ACP methyl ester carboxylesterase